MAKIVKANSRFSSLTAQEVGREVSHSQQDATRIVGDKHTLKMSTVIKIGLFALLLGLGTIVALLVGQAKEPTLADLSGVLARVVTPATQGIEALEALGWRQSAPKLLGIVAYVTLIGLMMRFYLAHFRPRSLEQPRYLWLLLLLLVLFGGVAWVMVPGHLLLPYLFPLATFSIMAAVLIDAQLSILATMLMGLIIGYLANGSLELAVYSMMGGLIGLLSLGRVERTNRLPWSGAYVALSNVTVVLIFHLPGGNPGPIGLSELMAVGVANGALSASLTFIGFFLVGNLLGITTSLQLLDLAQPTQPVLQRLLLRAPGTYHHSLMVSHLAEQAAERIGANALLTRVGAYYHDIGKMTQPHYFVENHPRGINAHDGLELHTSARIIVNHVKEGLNLAKKYHLPREVLAFIAEHHGTGVVKYFYHQALEQATDPAQVDKADFRYPGPRPQSRETAIVMLADSCEAATRAVRPTSAEEVDQLVHRLITDRIADGELDECDLTMRDLESIHHTFVKVLQGALHHRIEYPQEIKEDTADPDPVVWLTRPSPHHPNSDIFGNVVVVDTKEGQLVQNGRRYNVTYPS